MRCRCSACNKILGQATSLAAVTPGTAKVLTVEDLLALVQQMSRELLPEQDITGIIRDKAIRFQCRTKADIDSDLHPAPDSPQLP